MPAYSYRTPSWADPKQASVTDSTLTKIIRMLAGAVGADDPQSQVMGLATTTVPSGVARVGDLVRKPIRAYHGSPHDFDKFDMSKVGTGEGAEAYGRGMYFAEREGTARSYRDKLSQGVNVGGQNIAVGFGSGPQATAANALALKSMDYDAAIAHLESLTASPRRGPSAQQAIDVIRKWKAKGYVPKEATANGRMYEVAINADPAKMLDWDKPLAQQSQAVKDAIARKWPMADAMGWDASEFYRAAPSGERSKELLEAGIPGIKYLDGGSRQAGEGTSNYVVFDAGIIDILRKWGLLPAAVGAGAASGKASGLFED